MCHCPVGLRSEVVPFLLLEEQSPADVTSASSLPVFRNKLKTCVFRRFSDILRHFPDLTVMLLPSVQWSLQQFNCLSHSRNFITMTMMQTYRALHGDAPQYLRQFTPVADIPTRQRLRSSTSDDLCVPAVRLPTVGRRAFSVAGARVWNALPADVTSAPSLLTFRKRLKLHLFSLSYPGLVL